MINIAITGGIGAGKSTVTDHLIAKGYTVIDADRMSREMTGPGGKAMPYILEHFGPDFINEDGSLNRAAMRSLVFQAPRYKEILEEGTTRVVLEDIEKIKTEKAETGEKATTGCKHTYTEYFLWFTEPGLCSKHSGTELKYEERNENNKNNTIQNNVTEIIKGITDEIDEKEPPRDESTIKQDTTKIENNNMTNTQKNTNTSTTNNNSNVVNSTNNVNNTFITNTTDTISNTINNTRRNDTNNSNLEDNSTIDSTE